MSTYLSSTRATLVSTYLASTRDVVELDVARRFHLAAVLQPVDRDWLLTLDLDLPLDLGALIHRLQGRTQTGDVIRVHVAGSNIVQTDECL